MSSEISIMDVSTKAADRLDETRTALVAQLHYAYRGCVEVAEALNTSSQVGDMVALPQESRLVSEFDRRITSQILGYVATSQERDPGVKWTVVATPTPYMLPTHRDIARTARLTGKNASTHEYASTRGFDPYYVTDDQHRIRQMLSGIDPNDVRPFALSLFPNKANPDMYGTVRKQLEMLPKIQQEHPFLKPSRVLDDFAHWCTRRALESDHVEVPEVTISAGNPNEEKYIVHFDLPTRSYVGNGVAIAVVPRTLQDVDGDHHLSVADVNERSHTRLVIGL